MSNSCQADFLAALSRRCKTFPGNKDVEFTRSGNWPFVCIERDVLSVQTFPLDLVASDLSAQTVSTGSQQAGPAEELFASLISALRMQAGAATETDSKGSEKDSTDTAKEPNEEKQPEAVSVPVAISQLTPQQALFPFSLPAFFLTPLQRNVTENATESAGAITSATNAEVSPTVVQSGQNALAEAALFSPQGADDIPTAEDSSTEDPGATALPQALPELHKTVALPAPVPVEQSQRNDMPVPATEPAVARFDNENGPSAAPVELKQAPARASAELSFAARVTERGSHEAHSGGSSDPKSGEHQSPQAPAEPVHVEQKRAGAAHESSQTSASLARPQFVSEENAEERITSTASEALQNAPILAAPAGEHTRKDGSVSKQEVVPAAPVFAEPPVSNGQPGPVRSLNLQHEQVDIRLTERNGALHVAVRTPDAELARSLQGNLPEFVSQLDRGGFQAETWSPATVSTDKMDSSGGEQTPSGQGGSQGFHGQTPDGQSKGRRNQPEWWEEFDQRRDRRLEDESEEY